MSKTKWFKLDNAAKIFPPTSSKKDPKVFRFTCELKENIEKQFLEQALSDTLKLFPGFKTVLKKGLFWYYLETTDKQPKIKEEKIAPCTTIYNTDYHSLLFRVNFYKKRINLEIYHALTDGTGALEFLKVLVTFYIKYKYNEKIEIEYDASHSEKMNDSFDKYYNKNYIKKNNKSNHTYKLKGDKYKNSIKIIEGKMSTTKMLALAHQYNVSLTTLITAIYIYCISNDRTYRDKDKTISIVIPVNLRKYFKSATARNFFSTIKLDYKGYNESLEEIIYKIDKQLKEQLEIENISSRMNSYSALEHNFIVRLIPLFIKNIVLKIAGLINDNCTTSAISNIGKIDMPKSIQSYIDSFDVFVSAKQEQICMCSYLDKLVISFSTTFVSNDTIKEFFRVLTSKNIDIKISSNKIEG